jgi:hypothetical protein
MSELKRTDWKLLEAAAKSNGGGTADHWHAPTTIQRMIKAGLIQWKPNCNAKHVSLLTITKAGKEALAARNQE